ncbi:hypothetical protein ACJX0J_012491, partial [Zea mays]
MSTQITLTASLSTMFEMHYIILYYIILYYIILYYIILYYIILCYVMLCYVMLCYVMLCYVMLCYVIQEFQLGVLESSWDAFGKYDRVVVQSYLAKLDVWMVLTSN